MSLAFPFSVRRIGASSPEAHIVFWADSNFVIFGAEDGKGFEKAPWDELEFGDFVMATSAQPFPFNRFYPQLAQQSQHDHPAPQRIRPSGRRVSGG